MRIFKLYPIGESEDVLPLGDDALDRIAALDGTPRADTWSPLPAELVTVDEDGNRRERTDFPWLGGSALILRDQAVDLAGPILSPFGELLPLECESAKLMLFNATAILDVLDEEQSEIERFRSSGRIMGIEEYVFRPEGIADRAVFKIPQERVGSVFYTEPVVDDLKNLSLTGLDFTTVWSSEA